MLDFRSRQQDAAGLGLRRVLQLGCQRRALLAMTEDFPIAWDRGQLRQAQKMEAIANLLPGLYMTSTIYPR